VVIIGSLALGFVELAFFAVDLGSAALPQM